MKAKTIPPFSDGNPPHVVFYCLACRNNHCVPYTNKRPHTQTPLLWFFDENFESPTIEPSLRVFNIDGKTTACHVVVTNGILNYEGDCPNEFAGKRLPMQDVELISPD